MGKFSSTKPLQASWVHEALQRNATEKASFGIYGESPVHALNQRLMLEQQMKISKSQNVNATMLDAHRRMTLLNNKGKK